MNLTTVRQLMLRKIRRLCAGLDTPKEFLLLCVNYLMVFLGRKNYLLHLKARRDHSEKKYRAGDVYIFKEARLPFLKSSTGDIFWWGVFEDVFWTYLKHDDCYEESSMNSYYDLLDEGTYCLWNEAVDVRVDAGDVVLDVGSWVGDFAAYASAKGATVYAFEPSENNYDYLLKTAQLNKNVYPVKKGLSNVKSTVAFINNEEISSASGIVSDVPPNSKGHFIETTTIDAFVEENALNRVDFIKADIEGYERHMLEGAVKTLRKFAPKLAVCTYHLPDDPEVLAKIIKDANPAYNIVQKKKKLYASVPKEISRK
ncbi:MAG: FkbM family methyltransferase [Synergistaceae bacterium]|nr:FkbM family methyltransferase [Synergistaceae bacterium]